MLERILGQCPPELYSQYSIVPHINVNTRQREMKKHEPSVKVEQFIKKGN